MNKTAIISGSSRGIGAAIAEELAKKGWNVVLNYVRNGQKAEELKDKLSKYSAVIAVQADVSEPSGAEKLFTAAKNRFGKVDLLVNNAGISLIKPLDDVSYDK